MREGRRLSAEGHWLGFSHPSLDVYFVQLYSDSLVALADERFEAAMIDDVDRVVSIVDQSLLLKVIQEGGGALSGDGQHVGDEFARQRKRISTCSIVLREDPSSEPLRNRMDLLQAAD